MYRLLRWFLSLAYVAALWVVVQQTLAIWQTCGKVACSTNWYEVMHTLPTWLVVLTAIYAVLMGLVFLFQRASTQSR